jgi:flagellar biosynthesis protein FliR
MQFDVETTTLVTLLLVSARIFAWMLVAPPIATGGVPKVIKTVLSVGLGLAMVQGSRAHAPVAEVAPMAGALLEQILIGAALGFLTRLLFTAVEMAGSLLDLFGGFSLSAAYEPLTTTMTSVYGRFYALLCTTLIFATDAHLLIFQGFLRTFSAIPLDQSISLSAVSSTITHTVSEMFVSALQIAGPLIVVLFIADIALGVLNRIAPQLNAFSMSFPVKIGLTLLLVGLGFTLMPGTVVQIAHRANDVVTAVTG